jgi:hypothetical protein
MRRWGCKNFNYFRGLDSIYEGEIINFSQETNVIQPLFRSNSVLPHFSIWGDISFINKGNNQ